MNIETINYIGKIAGYAADSVRCARMSLKTARAYVSESLTDETTAYTDTDGVDFEAVHVALWQLATYGRKNMFFAAADLIVKKMNEARDTDALARRVRHTIKMAASAGLTVTAEEVLNTEAALADTFFSVQAAVAELGRRAELLPLLDAAEAAPAAVETVAIAAPAKIGRPRKNMAVITLEKVADKHTLPTYHVSMTNGRTYEYTDGFHFAFTIAKGGRFRRVTRNPRIVSLCRSAIAATRKQA